MLQQVRRRGLAIGAGDRRGFRATETGTQFQFPDDRDILGQRDQKMMVPWVLGLKSELFVTFTAFFSKESSCSIAIEMKSPQYLYEAPRPDFPKQLF